MSRWVASLLPAVIMFLLTASLMVIVDDPARPLGRALAPYRPDLVILFGAPLLLGLLSAWLYGLGRARRYRSCLVTSTVATLAWCGLMGLWGWWRIGFWETAVVFFYLSFVGPISLLAALLGGSLGYALQKFRSSDRY